MDSFKEYLNEALITFGKKRPKYNNVVIVAGGGGSGKGFVINNLLGIEGKHFDVDWLKTMSLKSTIIKKNLKKEFGIDISDLDMKKPEDVSALHAIIKKTKLDTRHRNILLQTIDPKNKNKPNLIFDVTLSTYPKFNDLVKTALNMGYDRKNIHIVWVLNKLSIALKQNKTRDRVVQTEILIDTHHGVESTMAEIFLKVNVNRKVLDGDIWIAFNQKNVDTALEISVLQGGRKKILPKLRNKGSYLKKASYVKIKEQGKKSDFKKFAKDVEDKIMNYPKITDEELNKYLDKK